MKKIASIGIVAIGVLLTGCASSADSEATPTPTAQVETEAPAASATPDGPSTEGYLLALTQRWGDASEADRQELCDGWRLLGSEETHKELGAPETFSVAHVEMTFSEWCRDYPES